MSRALVSAPFSVKKRQHTEAGREVNLRVIINHTALDPRPRCARKVLLESTKRLLHMFAAVREKKHSLDTLLMLEQLKQ